MAEHTLTEAERESLMDACPVTICASVGEHDDLFATVEAILAARLARVEVLADEWDGTVYKLPPGYPMTINEFCRYWFKAPLRAALAPAQPVSEPSDG